MNNMVNMDETKTSLGSIWHRWDPHIHIPGTLKNHYESDGLENADIRDTVCDILEGGKEAFEQRAKRLRVKI